MLNQRQMREYRRMRNEGYSAKTALAIIRHNEQVDDVEWTLGKEFERDGFTVVVTSEIDEYPDYSHLGEFTDRATSHHSEGEFLINPNSRHDRGVYRYFRLANPVRTIAESVIRLYGRQRAWETAWKQAKDDLQRALEYMAYVAIVRVYRDGIELGSDTLAGIEADDESDLIGVILDNSMIDNAIDDARRNLSKLHAG